MVKTKTMNLSKAKLNDQEYQELLSELAGIQTKAMTYNECYPKEIAEIENKIKIRGEVLEDNLSN